MGLLSGNELDNDKVYLILNFWRRTGKRRLSYGVVATAELELDTVTRVCLDLVWTENIGRASIFSSSHNHSDVDRDGGDDQRSKAGECSGELHDFCCRDEKKNCKK